jgi:hypothetical protein
MQHQRNIETEQSKRDARWNAARTIADCDAYMAIEAQSMARHAFQFIQRSGFDADRLRGASAVMNGHYRYARELLNITEQDQLYA